MAEESKLTMKPLLPLLPQEASRLRECEAVIESGVKTFVAVGSALLEIRDKRLYRDTHPTFETYCREKWQMRRGRAYELISGAKVIANLSSNGEHSDTLPANERQARELVPYEPEIQQAVWAIVKGTVPKGTKITAGHIKSVAIQVSEIANAGGMDDGYGVITPLGKLLKAHITEDVSERLRRQTQHIQDKLGDSDEWLLAAGPFLDAVRKALGGGIDLDPFSCEQANEVIKAKRYYTKENDGLALPWSGRVYANPPYSKPGPCVEKAIDQHDNKKTKATILLLNNQTDASWCQLLLKRFPICFPSSRVPFWRVDREGTGGARQGQVFSYLGSNEKLFIEAFSPLGTIMRAI